MTPGKLILLAILLLPAVEITVFFAVATVIGLLHALMLMVATSLAGFAVLSFFGRTLPDRLRAAFERGDDTLQYAGSNGFLVLLGGILLVLPGFITDVVGASLLLPPVRHWIAGALGRMLADNKSTDPSVVDLKRDEWSRMPERRLEKRGDAASSD